MNYLSCCHGVASGYELPKKHLLRADEQLTSAKLLDQRHLDLRLLAHRGGEANRQGFVILSCTYQAKCCKEELSTNRLFSRGIGLWAEEEPMRPIRIPTLSPEQLDALEELYRTTREARLRTRAQMVLLAAERRLTAAEIAEIVRASEETVRRWLKRYLAEGVEGLRDVPHPGAPRKVTEEYRELLVQVVRRRPRSLGLPFSVWRVRRVGDPKAGQTGVRVEYETGSVRLAAACIGLG